MKVGSLFAGVGGFDIAAERADMEVAWQSEIDKHASAVLEHYWPNLNLGDIHDITDTAGVDVLCGGFPCQDYSVAGNRAGLAGDRGALWWEFHRLIAEGCPTWVVAENVVGLLSSRGGRDFATIIDSLTELGYGVVWSVLDAQYFGVAQRRRRVFIVAHSGGQPRPEILALSEGVYGHTQPSRQTGQDITGTVTARLRKGVNAESAADGFLVQEVSAGSLVASFAENQRADVVETDYVRSISVGGGKPGQGYPAARIGSTVRRLTPTECERLQGFPDGWTDIPNNSDTQRYSQMGNAVAVPVVEWIMKRIKDAT